MQVDDTRMYRVKDVAEHFNVSAPTIYRAIKSGQLEALTFGNKGTLRVPGYAVRAYAQACGPSGLSPLQADGQACVICGRGYRRETRFTPRRPVGVSDTGSPVFACNTHPTEGIRVTAAGAYVDVINRIPEPAATAHIEACKRSLEAGKQVTHDAETSPGEVSR